jgi:hypothetical protein
MYCICALVWGGGLMSSFSRGGCVRVYLISVRDCSLLLQVLTLVTSVEKWLLSNA